MNLQQFVSTYLPFAQNTSAQTGLPVDYILGQAAYESGYGNSNAAVNGNNLFGISPGGSLASYPDIASGFNAFSALMGTSRYAGAASLGTTNPTALATFINNQGYSTTPSDVYSKGVSGAVANIDSILGTSGASTVSGQPTATTTPAQSSSTSTPGWLASIESSIGGQLVRVVMIIIGIVLLVGAVRMFANDSQARDTLTKAII